MATPAGMGGSPYRDNLFNSSLSHVQHLSLVCSNLTYLCYAISDKVVDMVRYYLLLSSIRQ